MVGIFSNTATDEGHSGVKIVPTKVMSDFVCKPVGGELTTSDETSDSRWVSKEEENSDSNVGDKEDKEILSQYSSEQIEYARVWLLLGENQNVDELNVTKIPAGTPINPNDETSARYPEDVIQLSGSRLVDGSVTYSGNGDGTINVYVVPLRWENSVPEDLDENYMSNYTQDIINDAELVYVDPGNDGEIIELIEVLFINKLTGAYLQ